MQENLASLIKNTAASVRTHDFLWTIAISTGIVIVVIGFQPQAWRLALLAWVVFLAALAVQFRLSSSRAWALPVQKIVEAEFAVQEAELSSLRLARGISEALPEPLFILDPEGVIELANPAAADFLGARDLEGRHFAAALRAPNVFEAAERLRTDDEPCAIEFATLGAVEQTCRAFLAPLKDEDQPGRVLVYIRDLTSERRVEQMRADFIASASHELRTPIASFLGFIETLRGHAKSDEEAREKFLTIMQGQAERMQRLVADLMSLSRIELNEHVPPSAKVDLCEAAQDVIESLAPLIEQSESIVDLELDSDGPVEVIGDRDEILQAIQNLIDNAEKYGGDPALIKVKVGRGAAPPLSIDGEVSHRVGDTPGQIAARQNIAIEDLAYVQVRDFGPGIERADLPRLTERFYRVNVERSLKTGGTGLGLAIVKHIVNRHKGGLQIESRLAAGTAFSCYFVAPNR